MSADSWYKCPKCKGSGYLETAKSFEEFELIGPVIKARIEIKCVRNECDFKFQHVFSKNTLGE